MSIVVNFAGAGRQGDSGDGGAAVDARLAEPSGLAVAPDGSVYIADSANNKVRRVVNDVITRVAGNDSRGDSGDGGPAIDASLNRPERIALGPDGSLYISDTGNHKVRRVTPDGIIQTIAGTGIAGFQGDGGPAIAAELMSPTGVVVDADGSVFVATSFTGEITREGLPAGLECIRRISPDGIITRVAGAAPREAEEFADPMPAILAVLSTPEGLALDKDGAILVADQDHNRVRRVLDGVIHTVAGVGATQGNPTGTILFTGDGGPANKAGVFGPSDVAVADDGTIYIADTFHNRIRRITNGNIMTIAGTGKEGSTGDGGLATEAKIGKPKAVAVGPDGSIYFTDTPSPDFDEDGEVIHDQHRVRRILPPERP